MSNPHRCAGCPTSTSKGQACQCLAAYAPDQAAYFLALKRTTGAVLTVLTTAPAPPSLETTCTGQMTCPCRKCSHDRATRQPQSVRQPWEARNAA